MNSISDTRVCAGAGGSALLPQAVELLRNARMADGAVRDLRLSAGGGGVVVADIAAPGELHSDNPETEVDLDGWLLLTAPAEPHAHLDKALSFDLIQPPLGDLNSAVAAWRAFVAHTTVAEIADRARTQALQMLASGITAIRTHVDVHPGFPTRSAEALVQIKQELHELIDIQLVALSSSFASNQEIEQALDLGLDLVGGAPHLAEDPNEEVTRLVQIAAERGLGLDLHTDENLYGPLTMPHYARLVRDLPHDQRRQYTASHCVRLGTLPHTELEQIITDVKAADIGVVSLPITNLYLQGWDQPILTPRGLTAIRALMEAEVRVCAGADNVQDPFNPVGRSCAFETASLLVTAAHLTPQEAWHLVSDGARDVMGLPTAGPQIGARAELLAVRANSVTEAIANGPSDRLVIHAGRLVARSELRSSIATAATQAAPHPPAITGVR